MAMLSFCGIDVSKDRLDVVVLPEQKCSSVRNDAAGWAELVEWLRGFSIAAIGLEASGGYERGAMRALLAAGMSVRQVNPFKLRQFARASGVLAKNDPLDTRMIASFVAIMPTRPAQRQTPTAERLAEMLAVRRQLSAEKVAAENASRLLEDAMLQRLSSRRIGRLAVDIDMLDGHLVKIVQTDATLAHRYQLLTSMPGVGPVLACTLIALLPELGRMSSQTGGCARRCRALRLRERQVQRKALHLGRSCASSSGALHGGDEREQLESGAQDVPRSAQGRRKAAEGCDRCGHAQDDHLAQRNASRRCCLGRPSWRSAQCADRTVATALIDLVGSRP